MAEETVKAEPVLSGGGGATDGETKQLSNPTAVGDKAHSPAANTHTGQPSAVLGQHRKQASKQASISSFTAESDGNWSALSGPNSTKQSVGASKHLSRCTETPRRLPNRCWLVSWKLRSPKALVTGAATASKNPQVPPQKKET